MLCGPHKHLESVAHIMNCCSSLKELYIARHDRVVDLIPAKIPRRENEQMHEHTTVCSEWFHSSADTFSGIVDTPDIFTISQNDNKVEMFEISGAFDLFLEESYGAKNIILRLLPLRT